MLVELNNVSKSFGLKIFIMFLLRLILFQHSIVHLFDKNLKRFSKKYEIFHIYLLYPRGELFSGRSKFFGSP